MTQEPIDYAITMPVAVEHRDIYDEERAVSEWFRCLEREGGRPATDKPTAKRITSGELVFGPDEDGKTTTIDLERGNLEAWTVRGKAYRP